MNPNEVVIELERRGGAVIQAIIDEEEVDEYRVGRVDGSSYYTWFSGSTALTDAMDQYKALILIILSEKEVES